MRSEKTLKFRIMKTKIIIIVLFLIDLLVQVELNFRRRPPPHHHQQQQPQEHPSGKSSRVNQVSPLLYMIHPPGRVRWLTFSPDRYHPPHILSQFEKGGRK